jgi:GT2 family glycosyltransferase
MTEWPATNPDLPPQLEAVPRMISVIIPTLNEEAFLAETIRRARAVPEVLGDQGFFVWREALEAIGGVPGLPPMEEFELCRRLRRRGRLVLAPATVSTSARRFHEQGVIRAYLRTWRVWALYRLGCAPEKLRRIYEAD